MRVELHRIIYRITQNYPSRSPRVVSHWVCGFAIPMPITAIFQYTEVHWSNAHLIPDSPGPGPRRGSPPGCWGSEWTPFGIAASWPGRGGALGSRRKNRGRSFGKIAFSLQVSPPLCCWSLFVLFACPERIKFGGELQLREDGDQVLTTCLQLILIQFSSLTARIPGR